MTRRDFLRAALRRGRQAACLRPRYILHGGRAWLGDGDCGGLGAARLQGICCWLVDESPVRDGGAGLLVVGGMDGVARVFVVLRRTCAGGLELLDTRGGLEGLGTWDTGCMEAVGLLFR